MDELHNHLQALTDGTETMPEFAQWLHDQAWEANHDDPAERSIGWGIENIIYQWQGSPDDISTETVVAAIREEIVKHQGWSNGNPEYRTSWINRCAEV